MSKHEEDLESIRREPMKPVQRIGFGLLSGSLLAGGVFWATGAVAIFKDGNYGWIIWMLASALFAVGGMFGLIKVLRG